MAHDSAIKKLFVFAEQCK
jgi:hypothetical protein